MSWGGNAWGGDASEDEEEKEEREMTNKKDYVVSLVDCRPNMFLKNELKLGSRASAIGGSRTSVVGGIC
jgi:hypothetical protein